MTDPREDEEPPDHIEILANASDVGTATHALIAALAIRFGTATPEQVWRVGRASLLGPNLSCPGRQALRAQVLSRAAVYFRDFARPGWKLVGTEVVAGDVAFDLLWERDGHLEADEIKTGRLRPADLRRARIQAQSQLEAGIGEYGEAFDAVRGVVLTRPWTSFVLRA